MEEQLIVCGHEFLVEFLEFDQHPLELIDLRQNGHAEVMGAWFLSEITASDGANT